MNKTRRNLIRAAAVLLLLLIAGSMFYIGRGHTVYLDNKTMEFEGQTYATPYKVTVYVNGEQVAKLYDNERGKSICIGPKFTMELEITQTKGGSEETRTIALRLPQKLDGIILNLPALLAGLPEEAYMSEFIIVPSEVEPEPEPSAEEDGLIPDEVVLPEDMPEAD